MRVSHLFRFPTPPAEAVHKTRPSAQTATATAFHHQINPSPSDASRIHPPPDINSVYDQVCFTQRRYSTPTNAYSSHSDASSWTWNLQDEIQAVCGDLVVLPHPTPPASTFVHTQSNYYTSTLGSVPSFTSHVVNNPQSMLPGMAFIDPDWEPNPDLVPARPVGWSLQRGGRRLVHFARTSTYNSFAAIGSILNASPTPTDISPRGAAPPLDDGGSQRYPSLPSTPTCTIHPPLHRGCCNCVDTVPGIGLGRLSVVPRTPFSAPCPVGSLSSTSWFTIPDPGAPTIQWFHTMTNGVGRVDIPANATPALDDLAYPPNLCFTGVAPLHSQYTVAWARIAFLSYLQDWASTRDKCDRRNLSRHPLPRDVVEVLHQVSTSYWKSYLDRVDQDLSEAVAAMTNAHIQLGAEAANRLRAHWTRMRCKRAGLAAAKAVIKKRAFAYGSPWARDGMYFVLVLPQHDIEIIVEDGYPPSPRRRSDGATMIWAEATDDGDACQWTVCPPCLGHRRDRR